VRLLIDTNIFLEVILDQAKAKEVRALLIKTKEHQFFLSDYSFHPIGLLLFHRKKHHVFRQFVNDMIIHAGMTIVSLSVDDMGSVIETSKKFSLDFDDAYQYSVSEKYDLTLVSFDSDFNRTDLGRKTPADILQWTDK